jgi:hypothetical protein
MSLIGMLARNFDEVVSPTNRARCAQNELCVAATGGGVVVVLIAVRLW